MSKKFIEKRVLYNDDLRNLCISKNWYTKGDNEQYSKLLKKCNDNMTTEDIIEIAEDILQHSKTEHYLESIAFEISKMMYSFFEEE